MSISEITTTLWRRRVLFAITLLASFGVVAVITAAIPRIYKATATIYVGTDAPRLDSSQGEQLSRTYTTLAGNPNVAQAAIEAAHLSLTRAALLDKMTFTPVERTQLLEISAEDRSPQAAQTLANTYAQVFAANVAKQAAAGDAPASVAVNQPAVVPTGPVRPNPPIYLGFGALLSLLIAAGVTLIRDRFDRRLKIGPRDDTIQGQPILARIPTLLNPAAGADNEPTSGIAGVARIVRSDALRVLRTNLDLASSNPARTITVTSPGQGEGKTTIAAQLALTMATDREKVAIVECDLRKPALDSSGFGDRSKRSPRGLAEFLNGEAKLSEVARSTRSKPELKIVWAGTPVAEPGPLLRSERLPELIDSLRRQHDWVIIDTPPIAVGDDALIASSCADGVVIVVDADVTTGPALEAGLNQMRAVRARVLGVVVNHAPPAELDAYRYLTEAGAQEDVELAK